MNKNIKNFITLFFVSLLLLFKVSGVHAISHYNDDSNIEHCEICEISNVSNSLPLIDTNTDVIPNTEYLSEQQGNKKIYFVSFINVYLYSYPSTRPPPHRS